MSDGSSPTQPTLPPHALGFSKQRGPDDALPAALVSEDPVEGWAQVTFWIDPKMWAHLKIAGEKHGLTVTDYLVKRALSGAPITIVQDFERAPDAVKGQE